ncbi:MAG: MBL fold metallo-hydrolase [Spirochaetes bacterium]|nr:MBL fold metallo-hydrolase [Spirochaetota bacterium]
MRVMFLGTGTSHGIPVVGCNCAVCTSSDEHNRRTRASIWIQVQRREKDSRCKSSSIVIDTATEFRLQAIRVGLKHLDAILLTHPHADHLHGLDDVRPLCSSDHPIPVFGTEGTLEELSRRFDYIFHPRQRGGGVPNLSLTTIFGGTPFQIHGISILPFTVKHGKLDILGYRIGTFAYITDCSSIPEETFPLLEGLDVLVLGALRKRPHPTHFSIPEALGVVERIQPRMTYLTHLCHEVDHETIKKELPVWVAPSYDGLQLDLEDPW